jgi:tryptophanyl-tRNA synthetase
MTSQISNGARRIFSGIQPSGNLHIGNYLGAIKNWVKLQDEYDSIFCVVDMHAITVPQNPEELKKKTIEVAKIYLASGIDPKKCSLFIQSHVQEHAELMWILNTIVKIPELERMTQFKDKSEKSGIDAGLLNYPVLMAADILLYDTNLVPVGKDQLQHIEITRTLANRFNKRFGETFVIPEPYITKEGMSIMGLDDPSKKMSKSAKSDYNYIALNDSDEDVRRKIKKAVTDSGSEIVYGDDKPALKNLINIYSLLSDISAKEIEKKYKGKGYAEFKTDLTEEIIKFLAPFQKRIEEYSDEKVLEILREGAEKVRPIAKAKLDEVREKIGFIS